MLEETGFDGAGKEGGASAEEMMQQGGEAEQDGQGRDDDEAVAEAERQTSPPLPHRPAVVERATPGRSHPRCLLSRVEGCYCHMRLPRIPPRSLNPPASIGGGGRSC